MDWKTNFIIIVGLGLGAWTALGAPSEIGVKDADLGTIREGGVYTTTVTLRNLGKDVMRLDSAKPGCGCIEEISPSSGVSIEPDTPLDILVKLNTLNKSGTTHQSIAFSFSTTTERHLNAIANVTATVEEFAKFNHSTQLSRVYNLNDEALLHYPFTTHEPSKNFTVHSTGSNTATSLFFQDATHGILDIWLPTTTSGYYSCIVTLYCGDHKKQVPIKWSVKDQMLDRCSIACGLLKVGETHAEDLTLTSSTTFRITSISDNKQELHWKQDSATGDNLLRTVIHTYFRSDVPRTICGTLNIIVENEGNSPSAHYMAVPYSAVYY